MIFSSHDPETTPTQLPILLPNSRVVVMKQLLGEMPKPKRSWVIDGFGWLVVAGLIWGGATMVAWWSKLS